MENKFIELIEQRKYVEIRKLLDEMNVVDIAELLEMIEDETNNEILLLVFRMIPKSKSAEVFAYLSYERQRKIIEAISDIEVSQIIHDLYIDDTVDFLEEMPADVVERVLENTSSITRKKINQILNYPEDSAGSLMTIEYVALKPDMTVSEALKKIRKVGVDRETIDTCYVINGERELEGVLTISDIIFANENEKVKDIMKTNVISVNTMQDQEEIADMFKKYNYNMMPVIDKDNKLVGIITVDDVIDVIDQEITEDIEHMAALAPSEDEYLKTNVFVLAKNRIVWLLVLLFSSIATELIIKDNSDIVQKFVILTTFFPILMDTSGNAGAQASTLIIRGMALNQINLKDFFKVILKEFFVGVIVAIALGIILQLKLSFVDKINPEINFIVTITLMLTIIVAKVIGGILPMIAKATKLDPATMAGPLMTTTIDVLTLLIYFGMARLIIFQ